MTCHYCQKPTTQGVRGPLKYCNQKCKTAAAWEKRKAKLTPADHRAQYERSARFRNAERPKSQAEACVVCGRPTRARDRCVSHYRDLMKREGAAWARLTDHASRASHYGVEYQPINRLEIFNRDGWNCQLCSKPVDAKLEFPDPGSASLDHVTPMSRGGGHVPANVQLAHLGCNKAKADGGVQDYIPAFLELTAAGLSRAEVAAAAGVTVRTVAWIRKRYA